VLANPASKAAVAQLPTAQQTAINAAVVVLKNGGTAAKDGGLGKLHAAAGQLDSTMIAMAQELQTNISGVADVKTLNIAGNTRITLETLTLRQNNIAMRTFSVTADVMANFWVNAPLTNIGGVVTYRNLSITISGHNLAKSYSSNHATTTAGESISLKLTPGEYTVTVVDLTNYGTQSSPQAPAFNVPLGVDIQHYLKTKIVGRVSTESSTQTMPVSLSVAEFSASGQRKESSEVNPLDPSKPVWVVIHGMDSSDKSNSILALAKAFAGYQNIQVVTLNWEEAAKDGFVTSFDSGDVRWAPAIGQWVARQLMAAGFSPGSINIAGHSHGSYVGFEMATEIQRISKGDQINSFVAMDAAGNAPIWSGYDHTKINFANVSKNAVAFDSAYALSSDSLTGTADVSFRIKTNSSVSIADQHGLSVTAFANILEHEKGSPGALSNYLSLGNLMASADSNKQKYQPNVLGEVFEGDIYVDVEDRQGIGGTYKNATPKGIMMKQIGDDAFDWIDINS
jgi:predicted alpha/beta hydrolase family esterase